MKNSLLLLFALILSIQLSAQERQREVGLVFQNLDDFGITYRVGTEKSLWRISTLLIDGNNAQLKEDSTLHKQNSTGIGIAFGREFRKSITDKLELRYGADIKFEYDKFTSDNDDQSMFNQDRFLERITNRYGMDIVLGLNYVINDKLILGAEILPNINYVVQTEELESTVKIESEITGWSYDLSNASAALSLVYRF